MVILYRCAHCGALGICREVRHRAACYERPPETRWRGVVRLELGGLELERADDDGVLVRLETGGT